MKLLRFDAWSPHPIDRPGMVARERAHWLVTDVCYARGAGDVAWSRFSRALRSFGGESDTVEVHRVRHWAVGWIDVVLVAPGSAAAKKAQKRAARREQP